MSCNSKDALLTLGEAQVSPANWLQRQHQLPSEGEARVTYATVNTV